MSFWSDRLGVERPAAAPTPPPAPRGNQPWWMPGAVPQASPAPVQQAPQQPQQSSVPPSGEASMEALLRQDGYTTQRAQSAKDTEVCPDCGSVNYIAPAGHPNAMKQCFNCGFNPRFAHSTAGATGIGQNNLPTRTARAQTLSQSNWNPQTAIAHIG